MLKISQTLFCLIATSFLSLVLAENAGSINVGIKSSVGSGSDLWNNGYSISGNIFWYDNPTIFYGVQMGFSHNTMEGFPGQMNIINIVPTLRAKTNTAKIIDLFGQFGIGYYRMSFRAGGSSPSRYLRISGDKNQVGFSIGGGILFGSSEQVRLEILPLYHIIAETDEIFTNYYSISIGIFLGNIKK